METIDRVAELMMTHRGILGIAARTRDRRDPQPSTPGPIKKMADAQAVPRAAIITRQLHALFDRPQATSIGARPRRQGTMLTQSAWEAVRLERVKRNLPRRWKSRKSAPPAQVVDMIVDAIKQIRRARASANRYGGAYGQSAEAGRSTASSFVSVSLNKVLTLSPTMEIVNETDKDRTCRSVVRHPHQGGSTRWLAPLIFASDVFVIEGCPRTMLEHKFSPEQYRHVRRDRGQEYRAVKRRRYRFSGRAQGQILQGSERKPELPARRQAAGNDLPSRTAGQGESAPMPHTAADVGRDAELDGATEAVDLSKASVCACRTGHSAVKIVGTRDCGAYR